MVWDLKDFNKALLAKQAWRVINKPKSLLSQLYRGRYFARNFFLDCAEGSRPSYGWRSLLHGRDLLTKGLMRAIRDGKETYVWLDIWIMDEQPRRAISKEITINPELKVSDLLNGNGNWNNNVVQSLFPPNEVVRIKSIFPDMHKKTSGSGHLQHHEHILLR